jgi:PleD family two-component response regulator
MDDSVMPSRPPLVLIANDQEWAARSLESILGPNGYAVLRAYTGRQALEFARTAQPDAVILDARMSDLDGVDVCRELRNDARFGLTTPIFITTAGTSDRAQTLEAYEAGAWEFFTEPLDGEVLLKKLGNYIRSKREADRIRDESLLDQITGLYNMRGLARRAREIAGEALRQHNPLACVAFATETEPPSALAQPDDAARVAAHMGSVFRRTGRISDVIGRLGQTEFAIIAPATEAKGVVRLVERLQESLQATPLSLAGEERTLKIRAGYCAVPDYAEASVDAVEMLLRAAAALRQTKAAEIAPGGSTIRAFDDVPARFVQ